MIDERTFFSEREFEFTPDRIFDAIADPEKLARWWGPEGFTNTFDEFDFRPGGSWKFTMHGPNGANFWNESFFESIDTDRAVVIRHDCEPYFTLTIAIEPCGDGSKLTWTQRFDDAETAQRVAAIVGNANEQNLDRLNRILHGVRALK